MSRAAVNFGILLEGTCWQCRGPLTRIADWAECFTCSRRFQIRCRQVVEQIAVPDDYRGKTIWLGGELLCADGQVVKPLDNGMVFIPWSAEWIVCTWSLT